MRRWANAVVFGVALAAAAPAAAGEGYGTVYGGLRVIGSYVKADGITTNGFTGTTRVENDDDLVAGIAGVLGYSFRRIPFRIEVAADYRFRFDFDVRDVVPEIIDYEMNVATTSALASAIIEWRNDTEFTPFVGVTAGWVRNTTNTKRVNLMTRVKTENEQVVDSFAYGGVVGVDWGFSERWSAEIAYRYLNMGEVETGTFSATDSISADDFISQDVLFSILYRF